MRLALVLGVLGKLLQVFAVAFLPPLALAAMDCAWGERPWWEAGVFALSAAATWTGGRVLALSAPEHPDFRRAEALAVVSGAWLLTAAFAALPYLLSGMSLINSLFESMSGLTTTGATVLNDFASPSRAFFLWRSMTQWFGGLGVIALFVVILPQLGIAGRQIFFAEASAATTDAISPRVREGARRLWALYVFLTILLISLLYLVAEMPIFESVCHALTTISAGGFSPHPLSVGGYENAAAEWIIILFMVVAGVSFPLLWIGLTRRPSEFVRDGEFRFYLLTVLMIGIGIAFELAEGRPDSAGLRTGLFQSASLITTTGFATEDWSQLPWSDTKRALLVLGMLLGGCAGSAAGGPKAIRNLLCVKFMWRELTRALHPRGVIPLRHKGRAIPDDAMRAILFVVLLYVVSYLVLGTALVLLGADFKTGYSAAIATVGNIGPGFAEIGPMNSFDPFNWVSKLLMIGGMWLGRLEMIAVLVLLHPDVWRRIEWRGKT